jgi:NitT/TauT family transport system substrate-binding protein
MCGGSARSVDALRRSADVRRAAPVQPGRMLLEYVPPQHRRVELRLLAAIGALLAIVGPGCAPSPSPVDRVRVAELGVSSDAAIYIGIEKGYFAEQRIEVDRQRFNTAGDIVTALSTGRLDVGSGAPTAGFFNALANGIPLKIEASNQRFEPGRDGGAVVIRKDLAGSIRTAADFKGKRLGVIGGGGSVSQILYDRILSPAGLSNSDVDLVRIPSGSDLLAALENGSIDASTLAEPALSTGLARGRIAIWKRYAEIAPGSENNLLMYSETFATRSDVARRFMVAWMKAARSYNDALFHGGDRDVFISIMTTHTLLTDPAAYEHISFSAIDPNGHVDLDSLSDLQEWYVSHGYVPKPAELAQAVDPSFAAYAVGVLGLYR